MVTNRSVKDLRDFNLKRLLLNYIIICTSEDVNMICKVLSQKYTIIKISYQVKVDSLIHLTQSPPGLQTPASFGNPTLTPARVESGLVQRYHGDGVKLGSAAALGGDVADKVAPGWRKCVTTRRKRQDPAINSL